MSAARRGWMVAVIAWALSAPLAAQQVYVQAPFHTAGSSYFERLGFGFSGNFGNNGFFNFGGVNSALPPFGGYDPSADARFGFGVRGNGWNANVNVAAASGYSSSMTSTTPSLMLTNGVPGSIFSGQQRPFVTGFVPYVGHFSPGLGYTERPPVVTSPLVDRIVRMQSELAQAAAAPVANRAAPVASNAPIPARASSAEQGARSLRAIRAANAAADEKTAAEIATHLEAGRRQEQAGQPGQALIDYGHAARKAQGEQQRQIQQKIAALREQLPKR